MTDLVLAEREGSALRLILNEPEKLNPLTHERMDALQAHLDEAAQDDSVRVVILQGAGRAFSAGYSLEPSRYLGASERSPYDVAQGMQQITERLLRVWDFPKPTIAQVHGYCLAGGAQFAAICDLTVVAVDAVIGMPQLPLGGGFISPLWSYAIGHKRAKELSFVVGSRMSGAEAAQWGWANRAVPAEELQDHVSSLAAEIARTPLKVLMAKKEANNFVLEAMGFREVVKHVSKVNGLSQLEPEVRAMRGRIRDEGLKAVLRDFHGD